MYDWMHAVATVTWGAAVGLALGQLTELKSMELELNTYDTILLYVPRVMSRLATRSYSGLRTNPCRV